MANIAIKHRRDTAANWTANNPILLEGQFGYETDSYTDGGSIRYYKFKLGDGVTAWADLDYLGFNSAGGGGGATNLGYTASPTNGIVTSDTGTDATLPLATGTNAGLLKPADFTKLSNLSGSNTGDQDLSGLVIKNAAITGATKTKVTYDSKGLVTSGADATTADIADSSNKRYVTDAQLTVIGNTSGTNTGDQTISDATISLTDITTNNVSTTKHGFAPKAPNDATKYLDGSGAWSVPAGGGGGGASVISPSQLNAWTNNWNPTGLSTATNIRVDVDSSFPFITGLTATSAGHEVTLENITNYVVGLKHESASSTAANRFSFGEDKFIYPNQAIKIIYDSTLQRWIYVSGCECVPDKFGQEYHQEFIGVPADGIMTSASAGTAAAVASVAGEAGKPGVVTISTGTSGAGEAYAYGVYPDAFAFASGTYVAIEFAVKLPVLSDGTNEYRARIGFVNNQGVGIVNGMALFYNNPSYSANWGLITRDGGAQTITNTGVAASTNWMNGKIIYYPDSHVEVWLDGTQVISNVTGTLPTSANIAAQIFQLGGTTNRQFLVDYMAAKTIYKQSR